MNMCLDTTTVTTDSQVDDVDAASSVQAISTLPILATTCERRNAYGAVGVVQGLHK